MDILPGSKHDQREKKAETDLPHYKTAHDMPMTTTGGEGSSKRNIVRRHGGGGQPRKGNVSKFATDDGTLDEPPEIDVKDPNYQDDADPQLVSNFD